MRTMNLKLLALALAMSAASFVQASDINVQILSATVKDQKIADATLTLQKNGEQSVTATTNTQGQALLNTTFADSEDALLIVKKTGYSNLVVKCPCADMTYAISSVMSSLDGMRIVLNWFATPSDLDSHIVYPNNHVYFSNMNGADALLDVDDTTGFGPETITVQRKHDGERYLYAVHDYSNRTDINSNVSSSPTNVISTLLSNRANMNSTILPGSSNMNLKMLSNSRAKVFVYVGQTLIKTYYVPTNKEGNLWTVFAVTESGEFQDFNTIKNVTSHDRLQTAEFQDVINTSSVLAVTSGVDSQARAKALNTQGETEFHAKKIDEAIRLFQAAIELDGNYGQAYSNLGLSFQKAGRVAEALWANRKAIALANGSTAPTVRASSHYNNGRIYEAAAQWSDALREYKYAKQEKSNAVYDTAIQRMIDKGAQ